jgi:hypothetical protein
VQLASTLLVALILTVFIRLKDAQFLTYDDDQFVTANAHVQSVDVPWALTSAQLGYYPLTWLSHMTDVQLFGLDAGAHHLMNVAFHALATLLLFFALGRFVPLGHAAAIAALFAIHPLHVESVAWISERKDTLSAVFGFAALIAYPKKPKLVAAFMIASLLAKQTLVTLPLLLLVLDWWRQRGQTPPGSDPFPSLAQKRPLFLIAAAGVVAAFLGQHNLGAIQQRSDLANVPVAYVTYLAKLFWPAKLAIIYPLAKHSPLAVIACTLLLLAITFAAWRLRNKAPYFLAGWLWFLIALLPVIGIVQIGIQALADRYTYIPAIGIFIAVVRAMPPRVLKFAAPVVILTLAVVAHRQTSYWRDTATLFAHSIAVTGPNLQADYILGQSLQQNDPDAALPPLRRAIAEADAQGDRKYALEAHVAAGVALLTKSVGTADRAARLQLIDEGVAECRAALRLAPNDPRALNNLAQAEQFRAQQLRAATD